MEKVSIIVPVYNQEKYLNKCLDSILEQTYRDFKCFLIDDGSTDSSPEILDEYAARDSRLCVVHKENEGASVARNVGFNMSESEYVCFLDSDDYLASNFIEVMLDKIISEDADVCTCGHYQFTDETLISSTYDYKEPVVLQDKMLEGYLLPIIGKIYKEGYLNYPGYIWGRIYKRNIIEVKCFVSERLCLPEDDLFHMYLTPNLKKAVFIEDKLVYYRVNEASLTHSYRSNMWNRLKNRHKQVTEFFNNYPKSKAISERVWASGFFSVYVALRNAYEKGTYNDFKKEMKAVRRDPLIHDVFKNINYALLRPRQKMMVFLLKNNMYLTLYKAKRLLFRQ